MIVLDTNVLSEIMRCEPSSVLNRIKDLMVSLPHITVITAAELRIGYSLLPAGRRRQLLSETVEQMLTAEFAERILPLDSNASHHYAALVAHCRAAGRPMPQHDALIAAITLSHGATLVTRNVKDFQFCDVPLINPWTE